MGLVTLLFFLRNFPSLRNEPTQRFNDVQLCGITSAGASLI